MGNKLKQRHRFHQDHIAAAVCFHALQGFKRRFLRNIAANESYSPLTAADCPVSGCPPSPLANSHLAPLCAYVQACQGGTQALVSSEVSCALLKMALQHSCLSITLHTRDCGLPPVTHWHAQLDASDARSCCLQGGCQYGPCSSGSSSPGTSSSG